MTQQKAITTTVGELVMAVTEEVIEVMGDSPRAYVVVSYVVSDLLSRYSMRKGYNSNRPVF